MVTLDDGCPASPYPHFPKMARPGRCGRQCVDIGQGIPSVGAAGAFRDGVDPGARRAPAIHVAPDAHANELLHLVARRPRSATAGPAAVRPLPTSPRSTDRAKLMPRAPQLHPMPTPRFPPPRCRFPSLPLGEPRALRLVSPGRATAAATVAERRFRSVYGSMRRLTTRPPPDQRQHARLETLVRGEMTGMPRSGAPALPSRRGCRSASSSPGAGSRRAYRRIEAFRRRGGTSSGDRASRRA